MTAAAKGIKALQKAVKKKRTADAKRKEKNKKARQRYAAKKREDERNKKRKEKEKTLAAKKETETGATPVTTKGMFERRGKEVEASRLDDDTGVAQEITDQIGTRGEQVSTGAGTRAMGFTKEMQTQGSRARAKRKVELENKERDGVITADEQDALDRMRKADALALRRQTGGKRIYKPRKKDEVSELMQEGVDFEGSTPQQRATAERNLQVRKALEDKQEKMNFKSGGMKKRKLTRAQQKQIEATETYAERVARIKREKQKKKRKSYASDTPTIRGQTMPVSPSTPRAARGGLMKVGHADYRKKGMFYVGGMSAKTTPINKGKR
jgi:hypothetical protein